MSIFEEFWYGNIEPTEYATSPLQGVQEIAGTDLQKRRKTQSHHAG